MQNVVLYKTTSCWRQALLNGFMNNGLAYAGCTSTSRNPSTESSRPPACLHVTFGIFHAGAGVGRLRSAGCLQPAQAWLQAALGSPFISAVHQLCLNSSRLR